MDVQSLIPKLTGASAQDQLQYVEDIIRMPLNARKASTNIITSTDTFQWGPWGVNRLQCNAPTADAVSGITSQKQLLSMLEFGVATDA